MDEQKPEENNSQLQNQNPLASDEQNQPQPHNHEFQQQLEQFQKAAAQPENQTQPSVSNHKKNKLIPMLLVVLVVALVAGGAYWFMNRQSKPTATKNSQPAIAKTNYLTGTDKYACAVAALTAILCENVETHAISKYEIPHFVGEPTTVKASPDGSKVLFVSFANTVSSPDTSQVFVVDNSGKLVKQLPDFTLGQTYGISWMNDSKTIVYDYSKTTGAGAKSQLYKYDTSTGKSTVLTSYKNGLYYPEQTKSGIIVANGQGGDNNKPEELAAVSSTDGTVKDIDTTAAYANQSDLTMRYFYNRSSDLFYAHGNSKDGSTDVTIAAKLVDANGKFKLVPVATYKKNIDTSSALIVTTKGILLSASGASQNGKYQLYDGKATTDLTLDSTKLINGLSFTANAPIFANAESTSDVTQSDYLYETTAAPAKLHTFLVSLTSQGCQSGHYKTITLLANDGDTQAAVTQGNCVQAGSINTPTDYYVYQRGAYVKVVSSKDNVSCADAAKYNLSKVVLPKCQP